MKCCVNSDVFRVRDSNAHSMFNELGFARIISTYLLGSIQAHLHVGDYGLSFSRSRIFEGFPGIPVEHLGVCTHRGRERSGEGEGEEQYQQQ